LLKANPKPRSGCVEYIEERAIAFMATVEQLIDLKKEVDVL